jgi:hypothetical protein
MYERGKDEFIIKSKNGYQYISIKLSNFQWSYFYQCAIFYFQDIRYS